MGPGCNVAAKRVACMSATQDEYIRTLLEANGAIQMGGAAHTKGNTLRVGSLAPITSFTQTVPALPSISS